MKFGIIREGKTPPDKRVVFSPQELLKVKNTYPNASFKIESSPIRVFADEEYAALGFEISEDMTDCDVLFGVKEVQFSKLIPDKTYFFFSRSEEHTSELQSRENLVCRLLLEKKK